MLALLPFILPVAALVGFAPAAAASVMPPVDDRASLLATPPSAPTDVTGGFPLWAVITLTATVAVLIALVVSIVRRSRRMQAHVPLR